VHILYTPAPLDYSLRVMLLCENRRQNSARDVFTVRQSFVPKHPARPREKYRVICDSCGQLVTADSGLSVRCSQCQQEIHLNEFTL
jgi:formylmethanofuran dehydrogenase subunit E